MHGLAAQKLADAAAQDGAAVTHADTSEQAMAVLRGGRKVPLKANTDAALLKTKNPAKVLVIRRTGAPVAFDPSRDLWYHEEAAKVSADCKPEKMKAEDPLFILYTSASYWLIQRLFAIGLAMAGQPA